jgi:hypothetical protein
MTTTTTIAGTEHTLHPCTPSLAWELAELAGKNPAAAQGAALGLCLPPGVCPVAPLARAHSVPLAQYGREVFDYFLSRKTGYAELRLAGAAALELAVQPCLTEDEVRAAAGFSAPGGSSTG